MQPGTTVMTTPLAGLGRHVARMARLWQATDVMPQGTTYRVKLAGSCGKLVRSRQGALHLGVLTVASCWSWMFRWETHAIQQWRWLIVVLRTVLSRSMLPARLVSPGIPALICSYAWLMGSGVLVWELRAICASSFCLA